MSNITREAIKAICKKKNTIPEEKFILTNDMGRCTPIKTEEQIKVYLQESRFDLLNNNFLTEIINFIESIYTDEIIYDYILDDYSADIYLPKLNLAFKGIFLFKYSEINVDKKYQLKTYNAFEKVGIKIIQIFQDSWELKQVIIKSRIKNLLGMSDKIYARKCVIKELNSEKETTIVSKFCDMNHTQGKVGASVKLGLFYNDELVSVMTFGGGRKNLGRDSVVGEYELLRFCNKLNTNVIGGAGKLFNYFIKTYHPTSVFSFADKSWSSSNDNLYKTLGLEYVHDSEPSYFYIVGNKRVGRFAYRKDQLLLCGYDLNYVSEDGHSWQEHSLCLVNNMYRIFDVGTVKFQWNKKITD